MKISHVNKQLTIACERWKVPAKHAKRMCNTIVKHMKYIDKTEADFTATYIYLSHRCMNAKMKNRRSKYVYAYNVNIPTYNGAFYTTVEITDKE
jgi:hypothetical protein